MKVNKIVVGYIEENCYILENDNSLIIVDPGDEFYKIKDKIDKLNKKVVCVLLTHAHFDHIGALDEVLTEYKVPLYYNNVNNEINYNNIINIEEKEYEVSHFKFKVIKTEGHRNDSVTFYFYEDNFMLTGDFLFKYSIGRTDLEYANHSDMIKSLNKIKKYDDNITIYPGHGEESTIGFEKQNNMYFGGIV